MDLGFDARLELEWQLAQFEDPQYVDPRDIPPHWHHHDHPSTVRLESLEHYAGRVYAGNSLRAQLPPRFYWSYTYPVGRGRGLFPVLEIWPMAPHPLSSNMRTFDYVQGPRVIMPEDRMGQTWSDTAPNPISSVPPQQSSGHATSSRSLDDGWTNTQARNTNNDSTNTIRASSTQVRNPFHPYMIPPPAYGQTSNQPLTFEELNEYNFLLNDQTEGASDHPITNSTTHSRPFSPPTRPISSRSWSSNETSLFDSTTQPTYHRTGGFVDLTADSSPPLMPAHVGQRNTPRLQASRDVSDSPSNPAKRRKTATGAVSVAPPPEPQPRTKIEEVDLRDIDDDTGLSQLLQKQRENTIKTQQEQDSKPANLANLQCIICMEPMVNITATHCGKSKSNTSNTSSCSLQKLIYLLSSQATSSATPVSWKRSSPASSKAKEENRTPGAPSAARRSSVTRITRTLSRWRSKL